MRACVCVCVSVSFSKYYLATHTQEPRIKLSTSEVRAASLFYFLVPLAGRKRANPAPSASSQHLLGARAQLPRPSVTSHAHEDQRNRSLTCLPCASGLCPQFRAAVARQRQAPGVLSYSSFLTRTGCTSGTGMVC